MKLVMIAHNMAIDVEVLEAMQAVGLDAYSQVPNTLGRGHASEPHLNNDVWPGANTLTLVAVADEQVEPLLERIRGLRQRLGHEGVKAFVLPIEAAT